MSLRKTSPTYYLGIFLSRIYAKSVQTVWEESCISQSCEIAPCHLFFEGIIQIVLCLTQVGF